MVIIYLDNTKNELHICSPNEKTRIVAINDPNLADFIPNDDIVYVDSAHYITKAQFIAWLTSKPTNEQEQHNDINTEWDPFKVASNTKSNVSGPSQTKNPHRKYFHCTNPGTVIIDDIKTKKYPEGLILSGKWQFVAIDEVGQDDLDESMKYKFLLAKNKIEIVDQKYVDANKHRQSKISPKEKALDAILVPIGQKAHAVADAGGLDFNSSVMEIEVE